MRPMELWEFSSACCTWRMEFTCISPKSAGMKREPRTIPPARSRYTRERAAGDHVDAGRILGVVVYRDAGCAEYDGREFDDAPPHVAGSGISFGDEIFSKQSSTD